MSGTFKGLTQAQIDRRLKDGRGQGQGSDYKPFIYTRDVSSLGRSHRLPGSKTRRLHHLLSDLELAIFLTLDRSPHVTDIREQFPMRVEDTVRIAEELGLPHGCYKGTPQVLTSDFLVDFEDPQRPSIAIQAKYSTDLQKPEVIERLELERRYWQEKGIPWVIVTEREVSKVAFANIQWLYPAHAEGD
ncbi:TPA: TnsA endonuclease N-terminal domain-containing protein, partial [Escherichia coli]|nr:heteromeric transposase endonuclease subunit TnsA [Escherichia coli]EFH4457626.1 heteromeric transposase endonuclease subunit TnsA [Escherichia coli]EFJ8927966.1 heteromeric transposase endonuclease subunit TnsA [Escherichia coli]HAY5641432.1 heteromeric transposase endonuclease subunit TnsA [Escherichia coli]HBU7864131.1 Tn7 transposase TnsA N-terminal domain-containing protein [Escherichia coli]